MIKHPPFIRQKLDEEFKKEVFPMRLNAQEQEMAKELMILFNVKSPVTAIKLSAGIGLNVLHNTFGGVVLKRLFKKDRVKLEDYYDSSDPKTIKL